MMLVNPYIFGLPYVGPFDGRTADLAEAYSVSRRLLSSYTGPLIRVRRSSDNAELDIGYDGAGALDVAALSAFVGANSAYVATLYGQHSGVHAVQATGAAQPRIINAGTLEVLAGRPTMRGLGGQYLEAALSGNNAAALSVYVNGSLEANFPGQAYARLISLASSADYTSTNATMIYRTATGDSVGSYFNGADTSPQAVTPGNAYVFQSVIKAGSPVNTFRLNKGSDVTASSGTPDFTFDKVRIMRGISPSDTGEHWTGCVSEVPIYRAGHDLTTRDAITDLLPII